MRGTVRTSAGERGLGSSEASGYSPDTIRVRMLGCFLVSVGSRTIEEREWRLRKAASLVKLLALKPGRQMHRERLMGLLWPDLDEKAAANNLRHALHMARKTLSPDPSNTRRTEV